MYTTAQNEYVAAQGVLANCIAAVSRPPTPPPTVARAAEPALTATDLVRAIHEMQSGSMRTYKADKPLFTGGDGGVDYFTFRDRLNTYLSQFRWTGSQQETEEQRIQATKDCLSQSASAHTARKQYVTVDELLNDLHRTFVPLLRDENLVKEIIQLPTRKCSPAELFKLLSQLDDELLPPLFWTKILVLMLVPTAQVGDIRLQLETCSTLKQVEERVLKVLALGAGAPVSVSGDIQMAAVSSGAASSSEVCRAFLHTNTCKFGARCRFLHVSKQKCLLEKRCLSCGSLNHFGKDCPFSRAQPAPPRGSGGASGGA